MAKRINILPYAPIGNLIKSATGRSVSKKGIIAMENILNIEVEKIIKLSNMLAHNVGRKTIKVVDLKLACKQLGINK